MNINAFIQTAFGAIIGGFVVIATNWLNTAREKRKEIQEWYEQRYVTEGIDPLVAYFTNLTFQFYKSPNNTSILLVPEAVVPVEALTRIEVLLGINGGMEFLNIFMAKINASLQKTEEDKDKAVTPLFEVMEMLYKLRQEVLELVPKKIYRKNQMLDVSQFRNDIVRLITDYVDETEAFKRKEALARQGVDDILHKWHP